METNKIKQYRKSKKLTIKELAEITGISAGYICHLENGTRNNPSKYIMEKIANALQKNILEIFFKI